MNKFNFGDRVEICFLPKGQEASPYMLKIGDRGTISDTTKWGGIYLVQFSGFNHPHEIPENWLKVSVQ